MSRTQSSTDQAAPELVQHLNSLYDMAGRPPYAAVANTVRERGRPTGITVRAGFRIRVADWLSGIHTPREFDGLFELLIADLVDRAVRRGVPRGALLTRPQWRRLWRDAIQNPHHPSRGEGEVCPYPGLAPYSADTALYFFGRDQAIDDVLTLISAPSDAQEGRLIAVVGVSGAGKSSLISAGLIPRLHSTYAVVSIEPGNDPYAALSAALATPVDTDLTQLSAWAGDQCAAKALLVIDQAEELFTECSQQARDTFLAALDHLLRTSSLTILIGLRVDFLQEWLRYAPFRAALNTAANTASATYVLGPMSRADLADSITRPAKLVGLRLGDGFVDAAVTDLCGTSLSTDYDPGSLPLLNHALAATWARRGTTNKITVEGWRAVGGVAGSLTDTAEHAWNTLSEDEQEAAKRILLSLVHLNVGGGRDTRRTRPRAALAVDAASSSALQALISAHLLVADKENRITVTHEILLTAWQRLRDWIDEDRTGLHARQELHTAAETWHSHGRAPHRLFGGDQLAQANAIADKGDGEHVAEFLAASNSAAQRARRVRQALLTSAAVVCVALLVLSLISWRSYRGAEAERRTSDLGKIEAQADRLQSTDPSTAAQLALLAQRLEPSARNTARVRASAGLPLGRVTPTNIGQIYDLDLNRDGTRLAAIGGADHQVHIWQRSPDGTLHGTEAKEGHSSFGTSVVWAPNSQRLVSTSDDGTARLWQFHSGRLSAGAVLRGHNSRVVMAAWSPDSRLIATAGYDNTIRVWDAERHTLVRTLRGHTAPVRHVAWSPDGRTIASGSDDRTARLWNALDGETVAVLNGHYDVVHALAWSRTGRLLVTGSDDSTVRLWDTTDPRNPKPVSTIAAHTGQVWSVAVSPDATRLLTTSLDGTARIWQIDDPARPYQIGQPLTAAPGASLYTAAWTPDSRGVITGGGDGTLRTWSLPSTVLASHIGRARPPAVRGVRAVTAVLDGTVGIVTLWTLLDPGAPRQLATASIPRVTAVDISSRHDLIAAGAARSTRLLSAATGGQELRQLAVLPSNATDANFVSFSPNGRSLLAQRDDYAFQIWNVEDPQHPIPGPVLDGRTQPGPGARLSTAAWSSNGRYIVTAGAGPAISLWEVGPRSVKLVHSAPHGSPSAINALATTADILAVGGESGGIRLWNIADGQLTPITPLRYGPRQHAVRTLTFVEDGHRLVAGGAAQTVTLWDTRQPTDLSTLGSVSLPGNHSRWYATAPPNGSVVVIAGDAGELQIIRLDDSAERRICAHTDISRDLWAQYVPTSIRYRPPCSR